MMFKRKHKGFINIPTAIVIAGIIIAIAIAYNKPNIEQKSEAIPIYTNKAIELGINKEDLSKCVQTDEIKNAVSDDIKEAQTLGISGTPSFLIIGPNDIAVPVSGAQPKEVFDNVIDGLIANEIPENKVENISKVIRPIDDSEHITGSTDAKITILEFSDYKCPFCSRVVGTLEQILAERSDVRLAYRHLPLTAIPGHEVALPAAETAECVSKILGNDAFWEYTNYLYKNQSSL